LSIVTASLSLYSAQKPGDLAFIRVVLLPGDHVQPGANAGARLIGSTVLRARRGAGDLNRYTLTGCLPQRSEPLPLAFAIQDGASYAGAILKAELTQAGITYSGTLLRQTLATIRVPCWPPPNRLRCTICCGSC
jgi:D-alanyl-D-alanine carboxypeptidase/D-alanyl-D-alanine-endopeptidase (penicillin-binding protein 4)